MCIRDRDTEDKDGKPIRVTLLRDTETPASVEDVYKRQDKHMKLQKSLDAFLFCCYAGMRYSDFTNLSKDVYKRQAGNCFFERIQ